MQRKLNYTIIHRTLLAGIGLLTSSQLPSLGQTVVKPAEEPWRTNLYAKSVDYGSFACGTKYKDVVNSFFRARPLKDFLPICHNDCPTIKCQPVLRVPPPAKAIRATGTVKVHVLVDELGSVLYARVLSGHPLLKAVSVQAACQTEFNPYPDHKRQGIMDFTVADGYEFLGVPFMANRVWD